MFEYLGWRWDSWIVLILAGAAIFLMLTVKETYAPAVLKAKAARMRKETGDDRYWCRYDQKISIVKLLKTNLSRPFILSFTEPILWFFNIWFVASAAAPLQRCPLLTCVSLSLCQDLRRLRHLVSSQAVKQSLGPRPVL